MNFGLMVNVWHDLMKRLNLLEVKLSIVSILMEKHSNKIATCGNNSKKYAEKTYYFQ